jgi:hypothetical protein
MNDLICPFSATLARDDYGCARANPVIRRGGTEFVCDSASAHARCRVFHATCKTVTLEQLGLEDDLTVVPRATLVKVQFGGLAGLQRICATGAARIDNIDNLLERALVRFGNVESIPYPVLLDDISGYRLPRRRNR